MFDGCGAELHVAGDTKLKGAGKSVVMRWEPIDTRARLALEHKRGQVKDGVANASVLRGRRDESTYHDIVIESTRSGRVGT